MKRVEESLPPIMTDHEVLSHRGPKVAVDAWRPVATLIEPERQADQRIHDVLTVFLANHECLFRCVYCDLWKQTLDEPTPQGAVPRQIDVAFEQFSETELSKASVVKLYNSGNFFDATAIPTVDWPNIAERVRPFERLIVENHPQLTNDRVLRFRDQIKSRLEVAMGLETIHPDVLPRLNKRMTVDDFASATRFLIEHEIDVRAFVLLRPPFLSEAEGVDWAIRSIRFAVDVGVGCVSVILTRANNGLMERLQAEGQFEPPRLRSLETVLQAGLEFAGPRARIFADVWDVARHADCSTCVAERIERLRQMNLTQSLMPRVRCSVCEP